MKKKKLKTQHNTENKRLMKLLAIASDTNVN